MRKLVHLLRHMVLAEAGGSLRKHSVKAVVCGSWRKRAEGGGRVVRWRKLAEGLAEAGRSGVSAEDGGSWRKLAEELRSIYYLWAVFFFEIGHLIFAATLACATQQDGATRYVTTVSFFVKFPQQKKFKKRPGQFLHTTWLGNFRGRYFARALRICYILGKAEAFPRDCPWWCVKIARRKNLKNCPGQFLRAIWLGNFRG